MTKTDPTDEDRRALNLFVRGFQISRVLRVVADLGIADRIAPHGSVPVEDLAADCHVVADPLRRVLRSG